jgi:hypothetical protein
MMDMESGTAGAELAQILPVRAGPVDLKVNYVVF